MPEVIDDLTIVNTDRLLRRVQLSPIQLVIGADGSKRPSSAVFKDPELSVNIESVMIAERRAPESMIAGMSGFSLTAIVAGVIRRHDAATGQSHPIVRDPDPPDNPAHGLVLGKKTSAFANAMVRSDEWIIPPVE